MKVRGAPAGSGTGGDPAAGLRRILLNAASLLGAYALPRAFTVIAAVVAARVLGPEAFGAYGTAAALAVLTSIAATLGMMQLLVRELARTPDRAPELLGAANAVKVLSGLAMLALLALLLSGWRTYPPEVVQCGVLLALAYAVGSWGENLGAWFQAAEEMHVWMQAQAAFGLVTGAAAVAAVLATGSVVWFAAAPLAGQVAALAWLLARLPPPLRTAWRTSRPTLLRLLRSVAPFTVSVMALTAYAKVDVILVEAWRGVGEAGLYAAAYKFVDVAQALSLVVATALYPRLSRAARRGAIRAARGADPAAARTGELLLLAGVPGAGVLWLIREPLVAALFGPAYGGSVPALAFLAPVLPLLAWNVFGTYVLAASGRMSVAAWLYGGAFVLDVGLVSLLVPSMGAAGAAAARLVAEAGLGLAMAAALRRVAGTSPNPRVAFAAVLSAGAAALVAWPAFPPGGATILYVAVAGGVYVAARVVPVRELAILRRAVTG